MNLDRGSVSLPDSNNRSAGNHRRAFFLCHKLDNTRSFSSHCEWLKHRRKLGAPRSVVESHETERRVVANARNRIFEKREQRRMKLLIRVVLTHHPRRSHSDLWLVIAGRGDNLRVELLNLLIPARNPV